MKLAPTSSAPVPADTVRRVACALSRIAVFLALPWACVVSRYHRGLLFLPFVLFCHFLAPENNRIRGCLSTLLSYYPQLFLSYERCLGFNCFSPVKSTPCAVSRRACVVSVYFFGTSAMGLAEKPEPPFTLGKVQKMSAPVSGQRSRFASSSIWNLLAPSQ